MQPTREEALELLNAPERLANLRQLVSDARAGRLALPTPGRDVNNHIHTIYSFSPYSPTAAVWFAWQAGLCTCGLMDHDSIAGAGEFIEAAGIVGMGSTVGLECRVKFDGTPFAGRRINNPDQDSVAYIALHGVPHGRTQELNDYFAPYRARRNLRNRRMVQAVNGLMSRYGVELDFERDVLPLSQAAHGGSVTERHLASALAYRLMERIGMGTELVSFLEGELGLSLSAKLRGFLSDAKNPHYMYDLLGLIKSDLIARFYLEATDECPDVREVLELSERLGAISCYAYLGDVGESVTGDKRAQRFEDAYLEELVPYLKRLGFRAVTYMPSRNTRVQLERVRALCEENGLFQISGEDINSPRQAFVCQAQRDPAFLHLYRATWALIAHEWRATQDPDDGLFGANSVRRWPEFDERVKAFAQLGENMRFDR